MHAAVLHEYGTPRFGEFQEPMAHEGQIVMDVEASGVNPFDMLISSGTFAIKPATLSCVVGQDAVGRLPDGRRMYCESTVAPYGAAAERTLVDRRAFVEVPEGLDPAIAAAIGNAGIAAWMSLTWRGKLVAGECVLVLGGTGAVGSLSVQLARLLGAGRVVAAGRDPERLERLGELGADACVQLGDDDTGERMITAVHPGADLIIDLTWGAPATLAMSSAARGARLVQVGNGAGADAVVSAAVVRTRSLAILGYASEHVPREARLDAYRHVADLVVAGQVRVDLERVPLEDVAVAWERQRKGVGDKQVLIPGTAAS